MLSGWRVGQDWTHPFAGSAFNLWLNLLETICDVTNGWLVLCLFGIFCVFVWCCRVCGYIYVSWILLAFLDEYCECRLFVGVELSMFARANITLSLQRKKFCATKLHGKTLVMWKFERWIKLFQDKVISNN